MRDFPYSFWIVISYVKKTLYIIKVDGKDENNHNANKNIETNLLRKVLKHSGEKKIIDKINTKISIDN